ncbi:MAG: HEAT repeat domain-containing protein, partial [Candidatus Saccharicenans sp.]|nr:HEAT repeat domain-containing protein [Candidatus Saccharicenans sp.]
MNAYATAVKRVISGLLLTLILIISALIASSPTPLVAMVMGSNHLGFNKFILPARPWPEEGIILRYKRSVGDVITYKQVFYAERQVALNRPEFFKFRIEWSVKVATVAERDGRYILAMQYNREKAQLLNQKELEAVLSPEEIFDALVEQTDFDLQATRVVEVDSSGRNLNHSYYYNEMFSGLHPLATRIFALPEGPVYPGLTYQVEAEEPVVMTYKGVIPWVVGEMHLFEGQVAGGRLRASFFKESGLLESLEYTGEYLVNRKLVKETYLYSFLGLKKMTPAEMLGDDFLNKAILHAALARDFFKVPASVVKSFLDSPDKSRRRLAAAYCAIRGVPNGLQLGSFINDSDPVVRFNAAKALALHASNPLPLKAMALNPADPLRARARNFFERSSYFVPGTYKQEFQKLQQYIYGQTEAEPEINPGLDKLQMLLKFMKPPGEHLGGFYKKFIRNPVSGKIQPYFIYLPVDYDPNEVFPVVVYFGGGDGRGDQALTEAYQELMKSDDMAGYLLVAPQAEGMWWEAASSEGFV